MALQTVTVSNLGGGVNDFLRANEINPAQSPTTSRNIRLDGLSKKTRLGYTTFADTLTSGTKILGMASYRRTSASDDRLAMGYNADLYVIDPENDASWTKITDTITSDTVINFANYRDWLFAFNGVDEPGRLEGTTYSEPFTKPDSIASTPLFLPAFGDVYLNSLWVSGVPTAPNTVFISKPALTDAPEDIYDFSGALGSGNAEEIKLPTRCTAVRTISTLGVIFTVDAAFYVDGFKDLGSSIVPNIFPIGGASGAVNHESTVVVENDIIYLTPQNEIKSIRRGFTDSVAAQVSPISNEILNFLQNNLDSDQSDSFGYYDQKNKLYKLFVKSAGSTFNDIRIVGDFRKVGNNGVPQWLIDDGMAFNAGVFYKGNSYIGSSILGQVYKDEEGLADDDDASITASWSTKDFTANNPTAFKRYRNVDIYGLITSTTSLTVKIFVDGKLVTTVVIDSNDITADEEGGIGAFKVGDKKVAGDDLVASELREFVKRIPIRVDGKKISMQFETDDINQDYRISQIDYSFIPKTKLFRPVSEVL
jgi:hypothetical protein